jgi:hypothetical protein
MMKVFGAPDETLEVDRDGFRSVISMDQKASAGIEPVKSLPVDDQLHQRGSVQMVPATTPAAVPVPARRDPGGFEEQVDTRVKTLGFMLHCPGVEIFRLCVCSA